MTSLIGRLLSEKAGKNLGDKLDRKQLSQKIKEQIARYARDILPELNEEEQFDFTGVNRYIEKHLFDKVTVCFNLPESYQRECARRNLIEAVYSEAGADTNLYTNI